MASARVPGAWRKKVDFICYFKGQIQRICQLERGVKFLVHFDPQNEDFEQFRKKIEYGKYYTFGATQDLYHHQECPRELIIYSLPRFNAWGDSDECRKFMMQMYVEGVLYIIPAPKGNTPRENTPIRQSTPLTVKAEESTVKEESPEDSSSQQMDSPPLVKFQSLPTPRQLEGRPRTSSTGEDGEIRRETPDRLGNRRNFLKRSRSPSIKTENRRGSLRRSRSPPPAEIGNRRRSRSRSSSPQYRQRSPDRRRGPNYEDYSRRRQELQYEDWSYQEGAFSWYKNPPPYYPPNPPQRYSHPREDYYVRPNPEYRPSYESYDRPQRPLRGRSPRSEYQNPQHPEQPSTTRSGCEPEEEDYY